MTLIIAMAGRHHSIMIAIFLLIWLGIAVREEVSYAKINDLTSARNRHGSRFIAGKPRNSDSPPVSNVAIS